MVICFVVDIDVFCWVIVTMMITRSGSSSPSPKKGVSANPKMKGKKKAIAFNLRLILWVLFHWRGSNQRLLHRERRRKRKGLKYCQWNFLLVWKGLALIVLVLPLLLRYFIISFVFFIVVYVNFHLVTISVTICIIWYFDILTETINICVIFVFQNVKLWFMCIIYIYIYICML